jgi:nucleoside-diphosphate-sugar epimerase
VKVLVTGGAGFIGSHLTERLVRDGHEVTVLDNLATGRRENLAGIDVRFIEGDIRDLATTTKAVRGAEIVFHQAALPSVPRSIQDPLDSDATNVIGTLNVLIAARDADVRRVVLASSSSVYGANGGLPKREAMRPEPISPYAAGKLAAEGYGRSFLEVYGLETVALRYFNVFGPRQDPRSQYAAVVPRFVVAGLEGRPLTVFGDGSQTRDFSFVSDIVDANLLAMEAPAASGRVLNVAGGRRVSLNELIAELGDVLETELEVELLDPRPGEVRHSRADITTARELIGYEPKVGLKAGLERTVESLRNGIPASLVST